MFAFYLNTLLFKPIAVMDYLRRDEDAMLLSSSALMAFMIGFVNALAWLSLVNMGSWVGITFAILIGFIAGLFFVLRGIIKSAILSLFIEHTHAVKITGSDLFILYSASFSLFSLMPFFIIISQITDQAVLIWVAYLFMWGYSLYLRQRFYHDLQGYLRTNAWLSVFIPMMVEGIYMILFGVMVLLMVSMTMGSGYQWIESQLRELFPF